MRGDEQQRRGMRHHVRSSRPADAPSDDVGFGNFARGDLADAPMHHPPEFWRALGLRAASRAADVRGPRRCDAERVEKGGSKAAGEIGPSEPCSATGVRACERDERIRLLVPVARSKLRRHPSIALGRASLYPRRAPTRHFRPRRHDRHEDATLIPPPPPPRARARGSPRDGRGVHRRGGVLEGEAKGRGDVEGDGGLPSGSRGRRRDASRAQV